jgi:tetratricopeptide (TPR) repeat protein
LASDLFAKTVELGYKAETAQYYRALALKRQGDLEAYKRALADGVEKFPADEKLSEALVNEYVKDASELYKKGVEILNAVNQKVNDGSLTTADNAYAEEVKKAKVEFQSAKEILEKAVKSDSEDENAKKLFEACTQNLAP